MIMSHEEICADYRQAKTPQKQIKILADLNCCDKREIVEILRAGGETLPGNYTKKTPVEKAAEKYVMEHLTERKKAPDQNESMTRKGVLEAAAACVCNDREREYGSPENNFRIIADLWADYLRGCGVELDFLEPHDVAAMMILLKVARIAGGRAKADSWVDAAGYAACGGELQKGGRK